MRAAARLVYFHKRGLLAANGWSEVLGNRGSTSQSNA
jgi:hypothetical protein